MNWVFPTPVSPTARKCFASSRRRMRSRLFPDIERETISPGGTVELLDSHEGTAPELDSFTSAFASVEIENAAEAKNECSRNAPGGKRRCQQVGHFVASVNSGAKPGMEITRVIC